MPVLLTSLRDWVPFPEDLGLDEQQKYLIHLLYLGYPLGVIPNRLNVCWTQVQLQAVCRAVCQQLHLEMPPAKPWQRLVNFRGKMIGAVEHLHGQRSDRGLSRYQETHIEQSVRHPHRKLGPRPKFPSGVRALTSSEYLPTPDGTLDG